LKQKTAENLCLGFVCREGRDFAKVSGFKNTRPIIFIKD